MNHSRFRLGSTVMLLGTCLVNCSSNSGNSGPLDGGFAGARTTTTTSGSGGSSTTAGGDAGSGPSTTGSVATTGPSTTVATGAGGSGGAGGASGTGGASGAGGTGGAVPSSDAGGPLCPASPDDDACTVCVKVSCCVEVTACLNDSQCLALAFCLGNCMGDVACEQMCYQEDSAGVPLQQAIGQCAVDKCAAECGLRERPSRVIRWFGHG
jgi:hypothetical protein